MGKIGAHLVPFLAEMGYKVIVTSRKQHASSDNVKYVVGNAHDIPFIKGLLQDSFKAIISFMTYTTEEFSTIMSLFLSVTDQYIFLSSCRAYAGSDEIIAEDAPRTLDVCKDDNYLLTDNYPLAKAKEENLLFESNKKNWTIVRPYLTYSETRLQLGFFEQNSWLMRAMIGKTLVFSEDLSSKYTTMTYGKDVAHCIGLLVGKQNSLGEVINITCGKSLRWGEVLNIYCDELQKCLGREVKVKFLQEAPIDRYPSEKWTYLYDRIYNRRFTSNKLIPIIGEYSFTEPEAGLRQCIRAFVDSPVAYGFSWAEQAILDKITGEHTSPKELKSIRDMTSYYLYRYNGNKTINAIKKIKNIIK